MLNSAIDDKITTKIDVIVIVDMMANVYRNTNQDNGSRCACLFAFLLGLRMGRYPFSEADALDAPFDVDDSTISRH